MRNVKFFALVFCMSALCASVLNAKSIQVCVIPLQQIVVPEARVFVGSLQHMFVRGHDGTGLNFEPENPMQFLDGKAKIGKQNYPGATCRSIFTTNNDNDYQNAWNAIVQAYDNAAANHRYSVADKNCQFITRKILTELGYTVPEAIETILGNQAACTIQ